MTSRVSAFARRVAGAAMLVAAGSSIAAVNWHRTWASFAHLDAASGRGPVSMATVEAQATFQQWALVTLVALVLWAAATTIPRMVRDGAAGAAGVGRLPSDSASVQDVATHQPERSS